MAQRLDADEVSDSDIDKGLALIELVHTHLENIDFDESSNCVAVLGTTGVGKSTVVSLLFGEGKLLVHHENAYSRVLVVEKSLPGVDIHSGCTSKTLIPGVFKTDVDGEKVVVFDMPGSQDTRGPFAALVVHSILKWILAKHEQMHFVLVATPPEERPQKVALVDMIDRVYDGCSNAVLVYTKCDADFEPESTTELEELGGNKINVPAFGLTKPPKKSKEGDDYSSTKADIRCAIRRKLICPVEPGNVVGGSVPESAQLLLGFVRKRMIANARGALSNSFLQIYKYDNFRRSLDEILELLDALSSQQALRFMEIANLLQQMVPRLCQFVRLQNVPTVVRAHKRLGIVGKWCGDEIILCKEEWLTEQCRDVLKMAENDLVTLEVLVHGYRHVERNEVTQTLVISGWRLHLSEETLLEIKDFVEMEHTRMNEDIPTVLLVGFASITLDISIQMWANLLVLSPNVHISSTVDLLQRQCLRVLGLVRMGFMVLLADMGEVLS